MRILKSFWRHSRSFIDECLGETLWDTSWPGGGAPKKKKESTATETKGLTVSRERLENFQNAVNGTFQTVDERIKKLTSRLDDNDAFLRKLSNHHTDLAERFNRKIEGIDRRLSLFGDEWTARHNAAGKAEGGNEGTH